jgi:hypothetical protein
MATVDVIGRRQRHPNLATTNSYIEGLDKGLVSKHHNRVPLSSTEDEATANLTASEQSEPSTVEDTNNKTWLPIFYISPIQSAVSFCQNIISMMFEV